MTQRRYVDRGRPYDHEAWRGLFSATLTTGVYSGMGLSVGTGSTVSVAAGGLALPNGIVVTESAAVSVALPSSFPPVAATTYTVRSHYAEVAMGLIGGTSMTYSVVESNLTEQPSDGAILGWIYHPGGGVALDATHLQDAPKLTVWDAARTYAARNPLVRYAPVGDAVALDTGITEENGVGSDLIPYWKSENVGVGGTLYASHYHRFRARTRPEKVFLSTIVDIGATIAVSVYDTAGTLAASATITDHVSWLTTEIEVPSTGTWTTNADFTVKVVPALGTNQAVKLASIEVDFWPFSLPIFE